MCTNELANSDRCEDATHDASPSYHRSPRFRAVRLLPRKRARGIPLAVSHAAPNLFWVAVFAPERSRRRDPGISDARRISAGVEKGLGCGGLFVLSRGEQPNSAHGGRGSGARRASTWPAAFATR